MPILDTPLPVFIGLTVFGFGLAAFMVGQAVAVAWKSAGLVVGYGLLLGLGDRFLAYALFQGKLFSLTGYLADTAVLVAIALVAFRITWARRMASQYPWLYRRDGLFHWRAVGLDGKNGGNPSP
ncbi:MAG: hypothetical protein EXR02_02955 [Rhodospirillales bacterium]|nr:hypothetical protein [Rhodospirillales bacterium]MSP80010.1 hypothetical protein [Rhodospirillales bacterium]